MHEYLVLKLIQTHIYKHINTHIYIYLYIYLIHIIYYGSRTPCEETNTTTKGADNKFSLGEEEEEVEGERGEERKKNIK
jgi:hypothetical protein